MLLAGPRLHPLWHTPFLPLLFLISCVTMGYAVVVLESSLSSKAFGRKPETKTLNSLYGVAVIVTWLYLGLRFVDLAARGRLGLALRLDIYALMFWVETALLVAAIVLYYRAGRKMTLGAMFRGGMLMALSGTLYRFDTYLVAFQPGEEWTYFPTVPEILITVGVVATEILIYIVLVKRFPILSGRPSVAHAH